MLVWCLTRNLAVGQGYLKWRSKERRQGAKQEVSGYCQFSLYNFRVVCPLQIIASCRSRAVTLIPFIGAHHDIVRVSRVPWYESGLASRSWEDNSLYPQHLNITAFAPAWVANRREGERLLCVEQVTSVLGQLEAWLYSLYPQESNTFFFSSHLNEERPVGPKKRTRFSFISEYLPVWDK